MCNVCSSLISVFFSVTLCNLKHSDDDCLFSSLSARDCIMLNEIGSRAVYMKSVLAFKGLF
jgi:hypothetical protein